MTEPSNTPKNDLRARAMTSATIDRMLFDLFIGCLDEARCAVGKPAKQRWIDRIKKGLDEWIEKQS